MDPQLASPSNPASPRKIENMSHEELIKHAKKQMMFLQKLKAKYDEVQKKITSQADYNKIKTELSEANTKVEDLNKKIQSAENTNLETQRSRNALKEEFECLNLKQETLLSSLQYLQEDYSKLTQEKDKLIQKNEQLEAQIVSDEEKFSKVSTEHKDTSDQLHDQLQQIVGLKDHIKKLDSNEQKLKAICKQLQKENNEAKNELSAMKISLDVFKSSEKSSTMKGNEKIKELNCAVDGFKAQLRTLQDENEKLKTSVAETEESRRSDNDKLKISLEKQKELLDQANCFENEKKVLEEQLDSHKKALNEQLEKFSNLESLHKKDCEELREKLLQTEKELDFSTTELQLLQKDLQGGSNTSQLENENLQLKSDIALLEEKHRDALKKIDDLSINWSESNKTLQSLEAEVLLKNEVIAEANLKLDDKTDQLSAERESKDIQMRDYDKIIEDLNLMLKDTKSQLESLNLKKDELLQSSSSMEAELVELTDEIKIKNESLKELDFLRSCNEQLKTDFLESSKSCELFKNESTQKSDQLFSLAAEKKLIEEKLLNLEEVLNAEKMKLKSAEDSKAILQEELNEENQTVCSLNTEVESLTLSNNHLQEQIQELQSSSSSDVSLVEELKQAQQNIGSKDEIIKNLRSNLSKLEEEYKEFKVGNNDKAFSGETLLSELRTENTNLKKKFDDAVKANENLKLDLDVSALKSEKLQSLQDEVVRLSVVEREKEDLQEQCKSLEEKLISEQQLLYSSQESNTELKESYGKLQQEKETLFEQINESQGKCNELENEVTRLGDENNKLEISLKELSDSLLVKDEDIKKLNESLGAIQNKDEERVNFSNNQLQQSEEMVSSLQSELTLLRDNMQKYKQEEELKSSAIVTELEEKLASSETSKVEFENLLEQSKQICMSQTEEINDLSKCIEMHKEDLTNSKLLLENAHQENNTLNTRLCDINKAYNEELEQQKVSFLIQIESLKEALLVSESNLEEIKLSLERKQETCKNLEELISTKEAEVSHLHKDNKELSRKVENLNEEISSLKLHSELVQANQQDVASDDGEHKKEMEALQQNIKEKETYSNKLKMIAVKAKKELDLSKQQLQSVQDENLQLQAKLTDASVKLKNAQAQVAGNVQLMQEEYDKLQDDIDRINSEKLGMHKLLDENLQQMAVVQSQKVDFQSKLMTLTDEHGALKKQKVDVEKLLATAKSTINSLEKEKEGISQEHHSVKQELEAVKIQMTSLAKSLEENKHQLVGSQTSLNEATKKIKQHDMMSLEIAQYEETVCNLQTKVGDYDVIIKEKDSEISDLEERIIALQKDRQELESLRIEAEDRVTKLKASLDESRTEVGDLLKMKQEMSEQVETCNHQCEFLQQQNEDYKLDISDKASECRLLQEKILSLQTSTQRSTEVLERKLKNAQTEIDFLKSEKETLSSEYESYKVRVHSVLKQQKSQNCQHQVKPDESQLNKLRQRVGQLQEKLLETENIVASRDNELDLLQGDYDRILRQQQQSSESALERETRWKSRVKSLQQEIGLLRKQHSDVTEKLSQQNDVIAATVSSRLESVKMEHDKVVESLKVELKTMSDELIGLRSEMKRKSEEAASSTPKRPSPAYRHHSYVEHPVDYRSMARESGEGEENPDQASVVSFEQILQSPQIRSVTELSDTASVTSEVQLKHLEAKLIAQNKQLEHSVEVARENEASVSRLSDQNKVLKEEIRRLEKNQERDKSVANMEYLKNVIYKFLTLPPCDERSHLVPVLDMMLKLNPEERKTIQSLAAGDDSSENTPSGGWGSYLQRWSGMQ